MGRSIAAAFRRLCAQPASGKPQIANGAEPAVRRRDHAGAGRVFQNVFAGEQTMILRTAKLLLVCALAFYYTLVVLDNIIDYDSNFQFVRHVLMMDSTFPGNHLIWRAINSP